MNTSRCVAVCFLIAVSGFATRAHAAGRKSGMPNVIILLADDLGYG